MWSHSEFQIMGAGTGKATSPMVDSLHMRRATTNRLVPTECSHQ